MFGVQCVSLGILSCAMRDVQYVHNVQYVYDAYWAYDMQCACDLLVCCLCAANKM